MKHIWKFVWPLAIFIIIFSMYRFSSSRNLSQGEILYHTHCLNCHQEQGKGLKKLIPSLVDPTYIAEHLQDLSCMIRTGVKGELIINDVIYNDNMPGNPQLKDIQVMHIVNYVLELNGLEAQRLNLKEVRGQLEACP